ncbi:MAG: DUF2157 domain-containing protein [Proteobacteria bacterium]|nr:DUF2157 domain-containing protein [Pseudomonadota bacterium]
MHPLSQTRINEMASTPENNQTVLLQKSVTRSMIDTLYQEGYINQHARDKSLAHFFPNPSWGTWTMSLLTILGFTFIICGIIFFFAFNWEKMHDYTKLTIVELGLFCCFVGCLVFSLKKLSGKLLLTAASMLIGVFMAVFGQIYQTGADASSLFITWSILIFPWVFVSEFAPLWFIWIIISNLAIILFWQQELTFSLNLIYFVFALLIVFNGFFLYLREHYSKSTVWLQNRWSRILLAIGILLLSMIPIEMLILGQNWQNISLVASASMGLVIHFYFLYCYRKLCIDLWVYALTILSLCIIVCTFGFERIQDIISHNELRWFMMLIFTIMVFTAGAFVLRKSTHSILEAHQ